MQSVLVKQTIFFPISFEVTFVTTMSVKIRLMAPGEIKKVKVREVIEDGIYFLAQSVFRNPNKF